MISVKSRTALSLAAVVGLVPVLTACPGDTIVEAVQVSNIELSTDAQPVRVGENFQLTATAFSASGEQLTRSLDWASSNTSVANVSGTGMVSAVGPGTATISASADGASASATIYAVDIPCAVDGTLRRGESGNGTLGPCSFTSGDFGGRSVDFWFLYVPGTATVDISLSSGEFDTYLILTDPSLSILDENDDASGTTLNSRLSLQLSPGVYVIGVTSYDSGETGSYQLTISQ